MDLETSTDQERRIPKDWRGHELLVAVLRSVGGELVFGQEHLLTTSTRAAGGTVLDVAFEPRDDGTIRLSLIEPPSEAPTSAADPAPRRG